MWVCHTGFPHSEISGSQVACHLTEAYRRLLRPSSLFDVKVSAICSYVVLTYSRCYTSIFVQICELHLFYCDLLPKIMDLITLDLCMSFLVLECIQLLMFVLAGCRVSQHRSVS
jgi:hypothetical protein